MPINIKLISNPQTKGFGNMKRFEALRLHPSDQRQCFLDEYHMSLSAQHAVHNDRNAPINFIYHNVPIR